MNEPPSSGDITLLLRRVTAGDIGAREPLADAVYAELRRIAAHLMAYERPDHTLQATVIAGEAYVNLVEQRDRDWQNRAHFFAVAAQAMRRILVDYSRRKLSNKRGGTMRRVEVDDVGTAPALSYEEILAVDQALERLKVIDPRQSQIVELRYFGGLSEEETAEVLEVSVSTVKRDWTVAKAWLYAELSGAGQHR